MTSRLTPLLWVINSEILMYYKVSIFFFILVNVVQENIVSMKDSMVLKTITMRLF